MALLIALPQAPEARRPDRRPEAARRARDRVLAKFVALGLTSPRLAAEAKQSPIPSRTPFPVVADRAAARLVARNTETRAIQTTLDAGLQRSLETMVASHLATLDPDTSAAILVVEVDGRAVRASVSGAGAERAGAFLDMTRAVRSPGSALKPFIYGLALDDGLAAPDTLIDDAPRRFGGYLPENFDRRFHGQVRVSEALQHSLNLPAVAMLQRVGPARFEAALTAAGARPRFPRRRLVEPGLALALGGVGLTLEEVVTLYAALGDGGVARPLAYAETTRWRQSRLMKPDSAAKILGILAKTPSPAGRAPGALIEGKPQIAFKTGTSYGFRDAWAFGVGGGYAVGVWVGRPDGAPRVGATGRADALPLLFAAFDRLAPSGAAPMMIADARAAPGQRKFDAGDAEAGPAILFPPNDAEVLVSGFGAESRGVALAARGGAAPLVWYAEGVPVDEEETSGRPIWRPSTPGFHEVIVVDAAGRRAKARVRVRG
jgi:penicillin-binding protein 1C